MISLSPAHVSTQPLICLQRFKQHNLNMPHPLALHLAGHAILQGVYCNKVHLFLQIPLRVSGPALAGLRLHAVWPAAQQPKGCAEPCCG